MSAGLKAAGAATRPAVLVIEDDDTIGEALEEGLDAQGFSVTRARLGKEALAAPESDVVLLDLGLPDADGRDICRELRQRSTVPIIVITARGDEIDRVTLLELGADDYVVKPFGFSELVARIRAVRRRAAATPTTEQDEPPQSIATLTIDRRARRVHIGDREVPLRPKEFDLLARLADEVGAVIRREDLISEVWDEHWWGPTKTLDVHIAALRRKLGDPRWITTVRGVGYRLEPPA